MLSSLSLSAIGVILLVLALLFHWLGVFTKGRSFMAFAGICCIGLSGWVGHILATIVGWAAKLAGTVTGAAFGVAVPLVLFVVLAAILLHDWWPKHSASKRTMWLAIAVAALLVLGVAGLPAVNGVPGTVRSVVGQAQTIGG